MVSKLIIVGTKTYLDSAIRSTLEESGYEIETCESVEGATNKLDPTWSNIILLDLDEKDITNKQIRDFKRNHKGVQIVAFSSRNYHPELMDSLSEDICACLSKPLSEEELLFWLNSMTEINLAPELKSKYPNG
jgi:DNA-binding NtrC family response regulator